MKGKVSSGLLMYKIKDNDIMVFIGHPGGLFWKNRDEGAWSIPKGEVDEGEDLLDAAIREFYEETGIRIDKERTELIELGSIVQKSGKIVHAWAFEGDWSGLLMGQSIVRMEWPLGSGKFISFPEIDKAGFFKVKEAKKKINSAQAEFIERLKKELG